MRVTQEEPYKWGVLAIHLSQATILFFNYRRILCPHDSLCSSDFFPPCKSSGNRNAQNRASHGRGQKNRPVMSTWLRCGNRSRREGIHRDGTPEPDLMPAPEPEHLRATDPCMCTCM